MEDSLGTSGVELDAMRRRTFSLLGLYLLGCSASGEPERASGAAAGTMQPPASGSTGPTSPTTSSGPPGTSTTANSSTAGDPGVTGDGPLFDIGPDETTGAPCDPVADDEQACDGIDDDCNGFIDDIDEGGDGDAVRVLVGFEVLDSLPYRDKAVAKAVRAQGFGRVEVKSRSVTQGSVSPFSMPM